MRRPFHPAASAVITVKPAPAATSVSEPWVDADPTIQQTGPLETSQKSSGPQSRNWELPRRCTQCGARYPDDFQVCPRDAAPLEEVHEQLDDPFLGKTMGGVYRITGLLGEGGMARVYEARHERLPERRFALKVLHDIYARNPEVVARFQREAKAASAIDHPNVVQVFDVHRTSEGIPYLVYEYLNGTDYDSLLDKRGRVDVALAVHVSRQVCAGLSAAHAHEVVHRDMKPANVFLIGEGTFPQVKILDFGISKTKVEGTELTRTGVVMGTPGYMAPEQATGGKITHLVDVYAVGAMLYRALTGQDPFEGDDATDVLRAVLTRDPPRPRSIEQSIPEALEVVIQRAMAREPAHRYADMEELDQALAPFDIRARLSVRPPPPSSDTAEPDDTRRLALMQAARRRGAALSQATREARAARPSIVLSSTVMFGTLIAAGLETISAAWPLASTRKPTDADGAWALMAVFVLSLPVLVAWARYLTRSVWDNTVLSVETALTCRRLLIAAAGSYAFASLLSRSLQELSLVETDTSDPIRRLTLLGLATTSMIAVYVVTRIGRRKRMAGS